MTTMEMMILWLVVRINEKKKNNTNSGIPIYGKAIINIQSAINLQVISGVILSLLLTVPAIAGIIVATRINAVRKN
jgi:hypothetical protein